MVVIGWGVVVWWFLEVWLVCDDVVCVCVVEGCVGVVVCEVGLDDFGWCCCVVWFCWLFWIVVVVGCVCVDGGMIWCEVVLIVLVIGGC